MTVRPDDGTHQARHRSEGIWHPPTRDLIRVGSPTRRWFLQTGLTGFAGLSMGQLLGLRARAEATKSPSDPKAVILIWLSGGPSHLDMWDPKPDAPVEVRGPFGSIPTALPGVRVGEYLPRQAAIMDKLTIVRSMDCSASNHTPITMQAGNPLARRTDDGKDGGGYPSMGSIAAKFRGANDPTLPAFVGLADSWAADVWGPGEMGSAYAPVKGSELAGQFKLPAGVSVDRLQARHELRRQFDAFRRAVDGEAVEKLDRHSQRAVEMIASGKVGRAFEVDAEDPKVRDGYGRDSLGEKALLARRLVEAGGTFVLVSGAWGYFDHHGDHVRWGGIEKGLKPLIPRVDRVLATLVEDLEARGLLDSTLVVTMGEFGRAPTINKEAGREHWTKVMSLVLAGGGLKHGQVIGATDSRGNDIAARRVTPQDLAATVFRHLGIDLDAQWLNSQGRPTPVVAASGRPIAELF